jgi:hypothetical protein
MAAYIQNLPGFETCAQNAKIAELALFPHFPSYISTVWLGRQVPYTVHIHDMGPYRQSLSGQSPGTRYSTICPRSVDNTYQDLPLHSEAPSSFMLHGSTTGTTGRKGRFGTPSATPPLIIDRLRLDSGAPRINYSKFFPILRPIYYAKFFPDLRSIYYAKLFPDLRPIYYSKSADVLPVLDAIQDLAVMGEPAALQMWNIHNLPL